MPRGISILGLAIGLTIFAWMRGWRWWALIPGGLSALMRAVSFHLTLESDRFLSSDAAVLLIMGQFLCVCVLGVMALKGRDYVGDE